MLKKKFSVDMPLTGMRQTERGAGGLGVEETEEMGHLVITV